MIANIALDDALILPHRANPTGLNFRERQVLRQPGLFEQRQRDHRVIVAGPTNLAALLTSFQMGFRSLALQKRSSEVWQLLGAIKTEFDRYGTVVNALSKQLTTASNSVESLGRRTRAMSRKLKDVELLTDQQAAEKLLGLSSNEIVDGGAEYAASFAEEPPSEIIVPDSRSARISGDI
jgi:DNA anti-recombination protein RmuC